MCVCVFYCRLFLPYKTWTYARSEIISSPVCVPPSPACFIINCLLFISTCFTFKPIPNAGKKKAATVDKFVSVRYEHKRTKQHTSWFTGSVTRNFELRHPRYVGSITKNSLLSATHWAEYFECCCAKRKGRHAVGDSDASWFFFLVDAWRYWKPYLLKEFSTVAHPLLLTSSANVLLPMHRSYLCPCWWNTQEFPATRAVVTVCYMKDRVSVHDEIDGR